MNEVTLIRAQRLYSEAGSIVAEEVKLRRRSGRNVLRLASLFKDLYDVFLQRVDQQEPLVLVPRKRGFADFREAMLEVLRPLDLGERTGWYYLSIGRHLLGKIHESELAEVPFEKIKLLARVAKSKAEIPAALIARAKDDEEPAVKLREAVEVMLHHGAPDHSDGPTRSLVLIGGKRLIDAVEEKIERLRPAVADGCSTFAPTDAEVIDFGLADCLAGIQETDRESEA